MRLIKKLVWECPIQSILDSIVLAEIATILFYGLLRFRQCSQLTSPVSASFPTTQTLQPHLIRNFRVFYIVPRPDTFIYAMLAIGESDDLMTLAFFSPLVFFQSPFDLSTNRFLQQII